MSASDGKATNITNDAPNDEHPTWSPDGMRLLFDSIDGSTLTTTIIDKDGTHRKPLTRTTSIDSGGATWAPDGSKIIYRFGVFGGAIGLEIASGLGADVNVLTSVTAGKNTSTPRWSPDGSLLAYLSDRTGPLAVNTVIPVGGGDMPISPGSDEDLAWSPDGSKIAFVRNMNGNREVMVMSKDGSSPKNLSTSAADDRHPRWSPDSTYVLFQSTRDGNNEIYRVRPDGTDLKNLTNNTADDHDADWAACPQ